MTISGAARLSGVIGWPVAHSRSPALHGHWLKRHDIDGAYVPLAVAPENLESAINGLKSLGFSGCNVTIPHKERVVALCDSVTQTAERIGAVNTLTFGADGSLLGDNTDAFGFLHNLTDHIAQLPLDKPAVLLGAGGAARAVLVALQEAGFGEIRLTNRTRARSDQLADQFAGHFGGIVTVVDWDERDRALEGAGLLVNSTSLGMAGQPPLSLDLSCLPRGAVVTDNVYAPLITPLLEAACQRGMVCVDGLGMLLHQARPGFAAWFGIDPVVDDALRCAVLGIQD